MDFPEPNLVKAVALALLVYIIVTYGHVLVQPKTTPAVAASKRVPSCGFPGCSKPAPLKCSRCREVSYCSKEHQKTHWKFHKKL
ncbi:hypothetical protein TrST_g1074 [Triparma strigata]|uniref:MYND-type domain-containing protein n=1 Tax=Triparma strigata TaxID=1606541 RepID=A0A9W7C0D0_9STRA|nr:hypothetical protein TrST_g1074 [Triparma strigata]